LVSPFFYAFWLWVARIFLGLMFFLVVGIVFSCWFFCIGWLELVRVISCLGKGTIRNGIRDFRRQRIKERLRSMGFSRDLPFLEY